MALIGQSPPFPANHGASGRYGNPAGRSSIGGLARTAPVIPDSLTCGTVAERFTQQSDLLAMVVVSGDGYGLVERASYLTRYLDRFNRDLFQRKPISALMEKDPLVLDWNTSIDKAGLLIAPGAAGAIRTAFIVLRDGVCVGFGTSVDLMRMIVSEAESRLLELRYAQHHLVQAQTFASLGRLVAGIAHEVNTPIGISLTAASHLRERVNDLLLLFKEKRLKESDFTAFAAAADEASAIVVQNIHRAADLIRSFKSVAVDQTTAERRAFDLRKLLDDVIRSLSPALKKSRLAVNVDCAETVELVSYPGPLTQVLTNLLLNALTHAFEEGASGRFEIVATHREPWIEIVCKDNGCGIAPENLPRVFEPFFTTRRAQGGSGLGLHIVHNIVNQILDGDITCASTLGLGTTFRIRLPRTIPHSLGAAAGDAAVATPQNSHS